MLLVNLTKECEFLNNSTKEDRFLASLIDGGRFLSFQLLTSSTFPLLKFPQKFCHSLMLTNNFLSGTC
jgi:hypothetical protein